MCHYRYCTHPKDEKELISVNGKLYHKECFQYEQDFKLFENLWRTWVDRNINFGQLNAAEKDLIRRGYSSDYILFGLDYVLKKDRWGLKWPAGLKFYLERPEVKRAYEEERYKKARIAMEKTMKEKEALPLDLSEPVVKPKINYKKRRGFDSILGGK